MTDIIYRPATLDDIDTFYDLYRHEHIESYGNFGMTKDEVFAEMKFRRWHTNCLCRVARLA